MKSVGYRLHRKVHLLAYKRVCNSSTTPIGSLPKCILLFIVIRLCHKFLNFTFRAVCKKTVLSFSRQSSGIQFLNNQRVLDSHLRVNDDTTRQQFIVQEVLLSFPYNACRFLSAREYHNLLPWLLFKRLPDDLTIQMQPIFPGRSSDKNLGEFSSRVRRKNTQCSRAQMTSSTH